MSGGLCSGMIVPMTFPIRTGTLFMESRKRRSFLFLLKPEVEGQFP